MALLTQFLAAFGNALGRNAYIAVESTRHHLVLFVLIIGATSNGRKGTAWQHVKGFMAEVDEQWAGDCTISGLSSGEGLIWKIRDPILKRVRKREGGPVVDYESVIEDHGVDDKRLW